MAIYCGPELREGGGGGGRIRKFMCVHATILKDRAHQSDQFAIM